MNKRNFIYIFFVIFTIKFITLLFFIDYLNNGELWTHLPKDDEGYLSAVENYLDYGEYYYDGEYSGQGKMYAPRVPGQSLTYLFFRSIFSKVTAINGLLIFQCLLFSFSISILVNSITKNLKLRPIIIIISLISIDSYLSFSNNIPYQAESLNISLTILGFYYLFKFIDNQRNSDLFYSGLFISIAFFFKVVSVISIAIIGLFLMYLVTKERKNAFYLVKYIMIFGSSFFLLETAWIIRNKIKTDKLIYFQEIGAISLDDNNSFHSKIRFCQAFGGDWVRWNPKSAILWFENDEYLEEMKFVRPKDNIFPDFIFNNDLTIEKLKIARKLNLEGEESKAIKIINEFTYNIKQNNPLQYHLISRIKYSLNLFFQSPTYYFPYSFNESNLFEKAIKLICFLVYLLIIILPIMFIPFYLYNYRKIGDLKIDFIYLFTFSYIFFYAFVVKTSEFRYNLISYLGFMTIAIIIIARLDHYKRLVKVLSKF